MRRAGDPLGRVGSAFCDGLGVKEREDPRPHSVLVGEAQSYTARQMGYKSRGKGRDIHDSGGIQTFPAISSLSVSGKDLIYFFSVILCVLIWMDTGAADRPAKSWPVFRMATRRLCSRAKLTAA